MVSHLFRRSWFGLEKELRLMLCLCSPSVSQQARRAAVLRISSSVLSSWLNLGNTPVQQLQLHHQPALTSTTSHEQTSVSPLDQTAHYAQEGLNIHFTHPTPMSSLPVSYHLMLRFCFLCSLIIVNLHHSASAWLCISLLGTSTLLSQVFL